jgi:thioredoxin-dependent peroxiredoxin
MSLFHLVTPRFPTLVACWALLTTSCSSPQRPDGGSGLLTKGETVLTLTATDQRDRVVRVGRETQELTVVYFYPKDGTPGCTAEACAFRDVWKRYEQANIRVIGVSNDDRSSHAAFAEKERLPFSLVADTEGTWARTFGVRDIAGFYSRVTFLLGANGVVLATYDDVDPGLHANQILEDAKVYQEPGSGRTSAGLVHSTTTETDVLAPAPRPALATAPSVHLKLQASVPTAADVGTNNFWLAVTLTPPPGSHLYWKHAGEVGLRTHIEFSGPREWHIGEVQYPGPRRLDTKRGQTGYGYSGPVTIVAHVTTMAPITQASARVFGSWLSCDVRCVKEDGQATVAWNMGEVSDLWLGSEQLLGRLPRPSNAVGMAASFDPQTQTLSVTYDAAGGLDVVEIFPELDLGPNDFVPKLETATIGRATWRWHARAEPQALTLLTELSGDESYYRVTNVQRGPLEARRER